MAMTYSGKISTAKSCPVGAAHPWVRSCDRRPPLTGTSAAQTSASSCDSSRSA